eukprot:XP_027303783.1 olfactory receptor 14C36-like [Anas platyrhynchos]
MQQMSNSTFPNKFLLLPFADTRELQLLHFALFLGIYLAALLGNGLILTAIACDHRIHTPMYFFLFNLALLDLGTITTTVPKAMANSLWDTRTISYVGCAAQVFFFVVFVAAEFSLLIIMAYDRYVAICKPLHYGTIMDSRACVNMAAAAYGSTFLYAVLHIANTFSLPLCQGNVLDQFFCEVPQILKLCCSVAYLRQVGLLVVSVILASGCFVFLVVSYVQIFRAVLRIPSHQGRHKAFSTCLPHLAVVSLFLSTVTFAYLKPPSMSFSSLNLLLAVLYSVVPPELREHQQTGGWNIACKVPPALAPHRIGMELDPVRQRGWESSSNAMGLKDHNQLTSAWADSRQEQAVLYMWHYKGSGTSEALSSVGSEWLLNSL